MTAIRNPQSEMVLQPLTPEQLLAYDQVLPEDLTIMDRIVLVGQLLLALRHPENNGPSAARAREIARRLATTMILALPEALPDEILTEWHKELDC